MEQLAAAPNFWGDQKRASAVQRELAAAKNLAEAWDGLAREQNDLAELIDLTDENDASAVAELTTAVEAFAADLRAAELTLFLSGPYDSGDATVTLHAGAGGVDAADWTAMLLRMYLRYAEQKGWRATILEKSENEGGGLKSATVEIAGEYAFGLLRGETGAHRLVRRSPFNSAGSRETSFAKVEVLPVLPDDGELEIKPEELRIDTYCASGAGGQHVNRTESAVRITHLPTGLVTSCQNERSQQQNRVQALALLRAKLAERQLREREEAERQLRGEPPRADFGGDAIRSYVLDDRRVKDRRTGLETRNPEAVLDGELEEFLQAYVRQNTRA